jgi:very-short-patch-repair endonuclease
VAESVHPGRDAFDVVIVDEASQSGPEALFLQYIAKQIVVVGDDKQISPEFVGVSREAVEALRMRYIPDLEFKDALGVDNSFFDQAVIRFGGRIRLKEHFRCMPEIIQFSNNLAYEAEPLIPLRQYNANRLPPIKTVHVADGYRKGDRNVANPPEAAAIVAQIQSCCEDPAYDEKTMGVISLQGEIERLLLEAIGPEEIDRRGIVCGDAYAFQGDERDIIFLSLVAARSENHRIGPLAGARDVQRFNVAASRARDQLWLFHSVTLDDLSPACMRYQLLSYCLNPRVESISSNVVIRDSSELQEPFDSLFEQQVFQRIQERGYRVRPQVEVAGYRIDLVVEGMEGRLAVECDGDKWHGPEEFAYDMGRQRDLERYGWQFWRVRSSTYYRDPDEALKSLWKKLDEMKIQPWSIDQEALTETVDQESVAIETEGRKTDPTSLKAIELPPSTSPMLEPKALGVEFTPYKSWEERPLPDPLTASMTNVLDALLEIIAAEGPVQCRRVYRKYAAAAGISGGSTVLRSVLNKTLYRGVQLSLLELRDETGEPGQIDKFARLVDAPEISIRERGDRALEEIPPSEIAAAMMSLARTHERSIPADAEDLFGILVHAYGLKRDPGDEIQIQVLNRALSFLQVSNENGHSPAIGHQLTLGD